jgi:septal ring factor EnvC (AmiA/AmiB activator)
VIFCCCALLWEHSAINISSAEENRSPAGNEPSQIPPQGVAPAAERNEFGAVLERLGDSRQKSYLEALKNIDEDLRKEYDALATNYAASRANYARLKSDLDRGREMPTFVLKNLQDLEARKSKIETGIRDFEKKKEELHTEALSSYGGALPAGLSQEWEKEEQAYRDYIDAVYRKIGWWMGMEYSPLWRNDEKLFWNNIQDYNSRQQEELDKLNKQ